MVHIQIIIFGINTSFKKREDKAHFPTFERVSVWIGNSSQGKWSHDIRPDCVENDR